VYPHDNLKTILQNADICFLNGGYVDWRKNSDEFARKYHMSWSRSFLRGFKVTR